MATCSDCKYFLAGDEVETKLGAKVQRGSCHRYPPATIQVQSQSQPVEGMSIKGNSLQRGIMGMQTIHACRSQFPVVLEDFWCGEWKVK